MSQKRLKDITIRRYGKRHALALLVLAIGVFLTASWLQYESLDPSRRIDQLQASKTMILLPTWNMKVEHCHGVLDVECRTLSVAQDIPFSFNDHFKYTNIPTEHQRNASSITKDSIKNLQGLLSSEHLKITYSTHLEDNTQRWLQQEEAVTLVLPSLSTPQIRLTAPLKSEWIKPHGGDMWIVLPHIKEPTPLLTMEMNIPIYTQSEEIHHPFPPALIRSTAITQYTELDRLIHSSKIYNHFSLILLALIASILVIILDHVMIMRFFAYFICLAASRALINTFYGDYGENTSHLYFNHLLIIIHSLMTMLYVGLAKQLCHLPLRTQTILSLGGISLLTHYILYYILPQQVTISHGPLWNDATGALLAAGCILFYTFKKTPQPNTTINHSTIRTAITTAVFFAYGISKTIEWLSTSGLFAKLYSWIDLIFFATIFMLSLLHVGSITAAITNISKLVKAKAKIDRDIAIGKELQSTILPTNTHTTHLYRWHTYTFPAKKLTGHWFDLRHITSQQDGQEYTYLVGCMTDVSGEGIAASMMTTNLASHWGLWCEEFKHHSQDISTSKYHHNTLNAVALKFDKALRGVRHHLTCSLSGFIYEPQKRHLTYLCVSDHHDSNNDRRIVISQGIAVSCHHTLLDSHVKEKASSQGWQTHTTTLGPESHYLLLFTHSLVPKDSDISSWLKNINEKSQQAKKSPAYFMAHQLREKRRTKHQHDDLTLMIIRIEETPPKTS
ncbi:MAG: hypothetical protein OXC44_04545 [Proteobacteria bacterium]|nr:hypothetical protein [Pseudomonadota bacterium]